MNANNEDLSPLWLREPISWSRGRTHAMSQRSSAGPLAHDTDVDAKLQGAPDAIHGEGRQPEMAGKR